MTGDPWAEDPACYLTDTEIGIINGTGTNKQHATNKACRASYDDNGAT
jgi:hypothetical protein